MNGLPHEAMRTAVAKLLIQRIGKEWRIKSLKEFDIGNKDAPRICFLGINETTGRLHWIFLSDFYHIGNFSRLTGKLRTKIQKMLRKWQLRNPENKNIVNPEEPIVIPIECALEAIKHIMRVKLILNPSLFLESPLKPQEYTEDSYLPNIYYYKDGKFITRDKKKPDNAYKAALGISMIALDENTPDFSPYAIIDPRSYEPGIWDVLLGIEQTIYLPINDFDSEKAKIKKGILLISFDEGKKWAINSVFGKSIAKLWDSMIEEKKAKSISNLKDLIKFRQYKVENLYENFTKDKIEDIKNKIESKWTEKFQQQSDIKNGIKILLALFETTLRFYHKYICYFDDYVVENAISKT